MFGTPSNLKSNRIGFRKSNLNHMTSTIIKFKKGQLFKCLCAWEEIHDVYLCITPQTFKEYNITETSHLYKLL